MARLPYVDPDAAPEPVRDALGRVPPLNIFRMMANADTAFRPWLRWGAALLGELQLDPLLRELAILRVARLTPHAEYEWVQHEGIAKAVGATDEQVAALARDDAAAACFDPVDRVVLRATDEIVRDGGPSDATFAELQSHFSNREIVELVLAVGFYMVMARLMISTRIDIEEAAGHRVLSSIKR